MTMTNDSELLQMAAATTRYLPRADVLFVANIALKHSCRFAMMVSAYAGQEMCERDFAALMLRIAKHIQKSAAS